MDCTEDHSLLKSDKTPVKPTECTRDLLEAEYPPVEEKYSALTYWQAFEWGKVLDLRKCSLRRALPRVEDSEFHPAGTTARSGWLL